MAADDIAALPVAEFAFPGPLRDRLVAQVLDGSKTATAALLASYEAVGEALPQAGERYAVVDSYERRVGVLEVAEVRVVSLAEVDEAHAAREGSASLAAWRQEHEEFWASAEVRAEVPGLVVDDSTLVVLERFRAAPSAS